MAVSGQVGNAGIAVSYDLSGVSDIIRELRQLQPDAAKDLQRGMKAAASPIIAEARSLMPTPSPLGNWGTWNLKRASGGNRDWTRKAYSGVQIKVNTGAPRGRNRIDLLELIQRDPAGAIYENAGRHPGVVGTKGEVFLANLAAKHGPYPANSSRYLWPAVYNNFDLINSIAQGIINRTLRNFEQKVAA